MEYNPFETSIDAMRMLNLDCSVSTFPRMCKKMNLSSYIAGSKFNLKQSHIEDRIDWCLERQEWGLEDWRSVVVSDEVPIDTYQLQHARKHHLGRKIRINLSEHTSLPLIPSLCMAL